MKQFFIFSICILIQFSCKTRKQRATSHCPSDLSAEGFGNNLIKDCPEELISNQIPTTGKSNPAKHYYIYKGFRREVKEFDSVWVSKHCKVKVTVVQ